MDAAVVGQSRAFGSSDTVRASIDDSAGVNGSDRPPNWSLSHGVEELP